MPVYVLNNKKFKDCVVSKCTQLTRNIVLSLASLVAPALAEATGVNILVLTETVLVLDFASVLSVVPVVVVVTPSSTGPSASTSPGTTAASAGASPGAVTSVGAGAPADARVLGVSAGAGARPRATP